MENDHDTPPHANCMPASEAFSMPIDEIDVSKPRLFQEDTIGHYFARLRRDDPVHFTENAVLRPLLVGDQVQGHHGRGHQPRRLFVRLDAGRHRAVERAELEQRLQMFIAMDPPKHDEQRKAVSPIVAPHNLASMESTIRARTAKVLDELPRNEEFNWVQRVSIELTTQMLATLFDFPFEDRKLLTWWSDVARTSVPEVDHIVESQEARMAELGRCSPTSRGCGTSASTPRRSNDLVSMLAHNPATRNMSPLEYMGNLVLLIVGGNDTTRNSMTGGLLAMNRAPRRMGQAARQPGAGGQHGAGDHPLADAAADDAPHRAGRTSNSAARRSSRATRW